MRKIFCVTLLLVIAIPTLAFCEREGFGLGVIIGEPTGISIKNWLKDTTAIDAAIAWSFSDYQSFQFHADYLFHNPRVIERSLPVYYGIGGRLKLTNNDIRNNDTRLGIRFPVGITYLFQNAPFDFFVEVVPILDVLPGTDVKLNAALGGRFYFKK